MSGNVVRKEVIDITRVITSSDPQSPSKVEPVRIVEKPGADIQPEDLFPSKPVKPGEKL